MDASIISSATRKNACNCSKNPRHRQKTYQLNTPSENTGLGVDRFIQFLAYKNLIRIDDREPTIQFPSWSIVIQILHQPTHSFPSHTFLNHSIAFWGRLIDSR